MHLVWMGGAYRSDLSKAGSSRLYIHHGGFPQPEGWGKPSRRLKPAPLAGCLVLSIMQPIVIERETICGH